MLMTLLSMSNQNGAPRSKDAAQIF